MAKIRDGFSKAFNKKGLKNFDNIVWGKKKEVAKQDKGCDNCKHGENSMHDPRCADCRCCDLFLWESKGAE